MLQTLDDKQKQSIRPQLQQRVVDALNSGAPLATRVAQRVIVFGMSQIPLATMQALAALSNDGHDGHTDRGADLLGDIEQGRSAGDLRAAQGPQR